MSNKFKLVQQIIITILIFSFQACSIKLPVEIEKVKSSKNSYDRTTHNNLKKEVTFKNGILDDKKVVIGTFKDMWYLQQNKKNIESYTFIKNALINEFDARKLPFKETNESVNIISIDKFKIYTHVSFAFGPVVYFSMLKVTAKIDGKEKSFSSIVKRAKVTALSRQAYVDSCYNEPIRILVKEITSKINREYFKYKLSDKKIESIVNDIKIGIEEKDKSNYLNIYELGFSNNENAVPFLIKYSNNPDEYLRLSSISILGLIGGESQFDYLVSKYKNSKLWQDRAFALKAISDINTKKSKEFIKQEYNLWKNKDTKEGKWYKMLMEVYM